MVALEFPYHKDVKNQIQKREGENQKLDFRSYENDQELDFRRGENNCEIKLFLYFTMYIPLTGVNVNM